MEDNKAITFIVCHPVHIFGDDDNKYSEIEVERSYNFLGRVPYYVINNPERYHVFCLIHALKSPDCTIEQYVRNAKASLAQFSSQTTDSIVLCIDHQLCKPLISEFKKIRSGPRMKCLVPDPVISPEIKTSKRHVTISEIKGDVPIMVKIGKEEIFENSN